MTVYDEQVLFARIAEGDEEAFSRIFHEYNSRLFPVVIRLLKNESEAEEVIQNVFLKLWLNREKLTEIENPGAWLNRVASNTAFNTLRSKATSAKHSKIIEQNSNPAEDELSLNLDAKELNHLINEAIEKLPPGRREVFRLSRFEGMSRVEIADHLGVSEHTVKNQVAAAMKFIQKYIQNKQGLYLPVLFFLPWQ